jgi:hypothetical protein
MSKNLKILSGKIGTDVSWLARSEPFPKDLSTPRLDSDK